MKTVGSMVLCVLLSSGMASAATLGPQSCTGVPETGTAATDLRGNVLCPQFDVAGGTLTSITLELTRSLVGSFTLTNTDSANSGTASAAVSSDFIFFEGAVGQPSETVFSLQFGCGPQTLAASETRTCAAPVSLGATNILNLTSNLTPYIGGGAFAIPIATLTGLTIVGGNGLVTGKLALQAAANARVTFEYEPSIVPEPTTLLLVGIGLVGLGRRWGR